MKLSDAHMEDTWLHGQHKTPKGYCLKCEYMPPQVPGPNKLYFTFLHLEEEA